MNVYEKIVILDASLSDEDIEASIQKLKDLITAQGGELLKVDPWGRRRLGYEINKHNRGYYTLFLFRGPSDIVKKLEKHCKVTDGIFKYMVVKLEKKQREATLTSLAEASAEAESPAGTEAPAEATAEAPSEAETPEAQEAPVAESESENVQ